MAKFAVCRAKIRPLNSQGVRKIIKKPEDVAGYKREINFVVNMNRKAKKSLFSKSDPKQSPKGFLDTFKPFFSNKVDFVDEKTQLIEGVSISSRNIDLAEAFNEHYIDKFSSHPSIIKILTL